MSPLRCLDVAAERLRVAVIQVIGTTFLSILMRPLAVRSDLPSN